MTRWLPTKRHLPIGLDIGSRSIKLIQFDTEVTRLVDVVRWDLPEIEDQEPDSPSQMKYIAESISQAKEGRKFRGKEVVLCLNHEDLLIKNVRVEKASDEEIKRLVEQEAASRVSFSMTEAEIRYIEAGDVRQGDHVLREVVMLACHRARLEKKIEIAIAAGLRPVAVDVEPLAVLRSYVKQFRRDEDYQKRTMFTHIGLSKTIVVIAQGQQVLFVKYIDIGGNKFNKAVARSLNLDIKAASTLRKHHGERRIDKKDLELIQSIDEATRPVLEELTNELSLCVRYHSVTFRGKPLSSLVLGGGEATAELCEMFSSKLNLPCELGNPLRNFELSNIKNEGVGQWDVAVGLALRNTNPITLNTKA